MRRARIFVIMLMLSALAFSADAVADDRISKKFQVVTPKDDRINAADINALGEIVGSEWVEHRDNPDIIGEIPFFARGKVLSLIPLLKGYTATFPAAVSEGGLVVGRASKPGSPTRRIMLRNQAFIWDRKSGIRGLGALDGDVASIACGVSRDGTAISGYSIGDNRIRVCVWEHVGDAWVGTALPQADRLGSNVVAISDDGRHVSAVDGTVPCLWSRGIGGKWIREVIGGPGALVPRAVNNSATVVGLTFAGDGRKHAVIRTPGIGCRPIEMPAGYVQSEANDVNNDGAVVGSIEKPGKTDMESYAFIYLRNGLELIESAGPNFIAANAINDNWQVVGLFEKDDEEAK